jgi:exosortase/archaeosortase family protein
MHDVAAQLLVEHDSIAVRRRFGIHDRGQNIVVHLHACGNVSGLGEGLRKYSSDGLAAMREIVSILPVAKAVTSPDGTLFVVVHHHQSFPISVVSACSGVNSVVGFLLIGSAFGAVVRGPVVRKVLWLVGGTLLLWAINLARITLIFWAGKTWGEHVALNILHPFIGLVTFAIGVLTMILLIRPLGMHIGIDRRVSPPATPTRRGSRARAVAVPKVYAAVVIVTVVAIVIGISNVGLKTYNLVADASGQPKLNSYITAPVAPVGWRLRRIAVFDWAKPLFGDTSIWSRYVLLTTSGGDLHALGVPVVADVIVTPDLGSFSAYGVEACYQFHGYSLRDVAQVNLGGGITGQAMSYGSPMYGSWSIVYWIIPVKFNGATSYERVVLYVRNSGRGVVVPATAKLSGITNVAGSLGPADAPLLRNRGFLLAFGRELIQAEAGRSAPHDAPAHPTLANARTPTTSTTAPGRLGVDPSVTLTTN